VPANFDKSGIAKVMPPDEMRRVVLDYLKVKDVDALGEGLEEVDRGLQLSSPEQLFKRAYQSVAFARIFAITDDHLDMDKTKKNAQQALDDLDAAIKAGVKDPRAQWAAARSAPTARQARRGSPGTRGGAKRPTRSNARYYWQMGQALYAGFAGESDDDSGFSFTSDQKLPKPSPEAAKYFGLATELAPDNDTYREQFQKMMSG
jgi:hypothetical protein